MSPCVRKNLRGWILYVLWSETLVCVLLFVYSIKIEIQAGKESAVDFSTGHEPTVYKAKNGHLMVVRRVLFLMMTSRVLSALP